jgi:hypothetical protein
MTPEELGTSPSTRNPTIKRKAGVKDKKGIVAEREEICKLRLYR